MPFVCECGSEDFYTHGDEEVVWYVDGNGDIYEGGDIVDSSQTHGWGYRCCECDKEYSQLPPKNAEAEWVDAQKRKYLSETSHCPICDSTDISGGSMEPGGNVIYQSVNCGNCDAEWTDIYYLRAVEIDSYSPDFLPQEELPSDGEIPNPNDAFKEQDVPF